MFLPLALHLLLGTTPLIAPERTIDRCAQDGAYFYAEGADSATAIQAEKDGVEILIERHDAKTAAAVITYSEGGSTLVQKPKAFRAAIGWLTVSQKGSFATTWQTNASDAETHLFLYTQQSGIVEDTELISKAQESFLADASRICKTPGVNTRAIRWLDDDHLLVAINAWASGVCASNFTEGFVLSISQHKVERKLTEQQMIDMPAVCTWNLMPIQHNQK